MYIGIFHSTPLILKNTGGWERNSRQEPKKASSNFQKHFFGDIRL